MSADGMVDSSVCICWKAGLEATDVVEVEVAVVEDTVVAVVTAVVAATLATTGVVAVEDAMVEDAAGDVDTGVGADVETASGDD